jgi:hypothetical protein
MGFGVGSPIWSVLAQGQDTFGYDIYLTAYNDPTFAQSDYEPTTHDSVMHVNIGA